MRVLDGTLVVNHVGSREGLHDDGLIEGHADGECIGGLVCFSEGTKLGLPVGDAIGLIVRG